jgi:hypothetical protein
VADIKAAWRGRCYGSIGIASETLWTSEQLALALTFEVFLTSRDGLYRVYGAYRTISRVVAAIVAIVVVGLVMLWLINFCAVRSADKTELAKIARDLALVPQ